MTTRYIVRDIATQGCDFLLWGDDDKEAAQVSLEQALADGLDVELVEMPSDKMDDHTARLVEGEPRFEAEYNDGLVWVTRNGVTVGVYRTWEEADERMNGE